MMNYKCKSPRGLNTMDKKKVLCIIECAPHITRVYAQIITDKRVSTLFPIIVNRVFPEI
jgi:hypothetical protein